MATTITKAEVQKLIAEAKEALNARITELVTRCNVLEADLVGDEAAATKARAELAEVQAEIAKLEVETPPTSEPPEPEPTPPVPASAGLGAFRYAIATSPTAISHPDEIVIVQYWRTDLITEARKVGAKVLIYQDATRAEEPNSEGLYNSALTLKQAKVLGAATSEADSDEGGYVCLPGTAGFARASAEAMITAAKKAGADGVFLDDVNTKEGQSWAESTWNTQMQSFNSIVGPLLKAAGLLSIANVSGCIGQRDEENDGWCEAQFAYFDGALDEFFGAWPNGILMSSTWTTRALGIMQRQTAAGKLYLAGVNRPSSAKPDNAQTTYLIAQLLLHTEGGALFFGMDQDYSIEDWTPTLEKALALGAPSGPVVSASRTFEHGSVKVSGTTGTITVT